MMTVRGRISSRLFGNGGMIDPAKNDPASSGLRIDRSLKIIDCFLDRVPAWFQREKRGCIAVIVVRFQLSLRRSCDRLFHLG
jgi:hypothetical protein